LQLVTHAAQAFRPSHGVAQLARRQIVTVQLGNPKS